MFSLLIEVVGYATQYVYLKSYMYLYDLAYKNTIGYLHDYIYMTGRTYIESALGSIILMMTYQKFYIYDLIEYYYRYLILTLPPHLFGTPTLRIQQKETSNDSSGSSSDEADDVDVINVQMKQYDIIVSQLMFVFKTKEEPPTMTYRVMNGAQLRPFIDDKGRFFVGHIHQYYPMLDTIIIRYIKITTESNVNQLMDPPALTKIIDVKKRFDIRNGVSCKLGVYL